MTGSRQSLLRRTSRDYSCLVAQGVRHRRHRGTLSSIALGISGGDGFAAGFSYGLLSGETCEEAVTLGWAHGALLTTFPGDTSMATVEQMRALATERPVWRRRQGGWRRG